MRILELSLRNYRVFEQVDLELPARVIGIFGENGSGKCVPGWVRVHDADVGESVPIERFVSQRRKRTFGFADGVVRPVDVTDWMALGEKPIVRLRLKNGAAIEVASSHPILTDRGCVSAGELTTKDWVAEVSRLPQSGPPRLSVDEALILGLLLGDGTLTSSVTLTATESEIIDIFRQAVERAFPGCTVHPSGGGKMAWIVVSRLSATERRQRSADLARRLIDFGIPLGAYLGPNIHRFVRGDSAIGWETIDSIEVDFGIDLFEDRCALHGGRAFVEWLRSLGLIGLRASTKRVPAACLFLPDEQVRALLAGLWLTDGWFFLSKDRRVRASIGTNSPQLAGDIRLLLLRLGLQSTMNVHRGSTKAPNYRVNLTADSIRRFVKQVPLVGHKARAAEAVGAVLSERRSWPNRDLIPPRFNRGVPKHSGTGPFRTKAQLARHAMSREVFLDFGGDPSVAAAEIHWSQVRSVESIGSAPCFDITVDSTEHLYVAETFVVHNSSLFESVAFGLYGVPAARTKKNEIRTHGVLTDCEVRVAFEHGGHPYEVRRTLRGKGATPEAELFAGDLTLAAGTTEVDAEIRRLLHMDLPVFRASVFAEQKQLDAFSSLRAGERKEMALRLLGIKPVDDARTAARREARSTKESAAQLAEAVADIAALEAELKEAKDAAAEAKAVAKAAGVELKATTATRKAARAAFDEIDTTRQRVEKLTVRLTSLGEERDRGAVHRDDLAERVEELTASVAGLPDLEEELASLAGVEDRLRAAERLGDLVRSAAATQEKLDALPALDAGSAVAALEAAEMELATARDEAAAARADHDRCTASLADAEARLTRASEADPSEPCPTCGRPLGDDFAGYVRHRRTEVAEAKKAARASESAAKRAAARLRSATAAAKAAGSVAEKARDAAARRAHLEEQVGPLRAEVATLLEPFDGEMPDTDELRVSADRARELAKRLAELGAEGKHLRELEKDLGTADARLGELERELGRLADEAEGLSFDEAEHARLREALATADEALELARAAERDAADGTKNAERRIAEATGELRQAQEVAEKVGELRSQARHVERVAMLLDGFRDHLVSRVGPDLSREAEALFRDLTNREYDDLRIEDETLAIQIADGDAYHPIERFSGSETDLANLALRVAISTHLSRVSGADVGLMVLDEVFGSLDEERKDLMVHALGRLSERFHQLFVITHAERVKDQFPATILVSKAGRRRSVATLV